PLALARSADGEVEELPTAGSIDERVAQAHQLLSSVRIRWQWLLQSLDAPVAASLADLQRVGLEGLLPEIRARLMRQPKLAVFDRLQDRTIRVSWKHELRAGLAQILNGRVYAPTLEACDQVHRRVLRSRLFVALHMHAGDGNVHTNIPVNSDDYEMLHAAAAA